MKLNQKALNKKTNSTSLVYQEIEERLTEFLKKGGKLKIKSVIGKSGIHIKKKNEGKFTASAKAAGQSVQEHATSVLNDPNATALQKKRANFAKVAATWKHKGK